MESSPLKAWKPSPKYAAMLELPPVQSAPPPEYKAWGFGSKAAHKAWSPPQAPSLPSDWWKRDKSYAGSAA